MNSTVKSTRSKWLSNVYENKTTKQATQHTVAMHSSKSSSVYNITAIIAIKLWLLLASLKLKFYRFIHHLMLFGKPRVPICLPNQAMNIKLSQKYRLYAHKVHQNHIWKHRQEQWLRDPSSETLSRSKTSIDSMLILCWALPFKHNKISGVGFKLRNLRSWYSLRFGKHAAYIVVYL